MTLIVEFAPGFGPLDEIGALDWVDLSDRLLSASWSEGRDDELEHYGPGQATIVLKNDDRELDPDHAGGTYYGELLPRVAFRLREVVGGTPEDRFYGFVEGGFQQELMPPAAATCTVQLTDRLSAINGLLPDVFEHAVQASGPAAFWMLDGPTGTEQVADRTGNGNDGDVVGDVKFGEQSVSGASPSASFDGDGDYVFCGRSPLIDTTAASVVVTFAIDRAPTYLTEEFKLFSQLDGNGLFIGAKMSTTFVLSVRPDVDGSRAWPAIYYSDTATDNFGLAQSPVNVADRQPHIVFAEAAVTRIAVDSADFASHGPTSSGGAVSGAGIYLGGDKDRSIDGRIEAVALFDRKLTLVERQTILTGFNHLSGMRSDEQIAWALDRIGVPAAHRNLDAGTVTIGAANTKGKDVLGWIREVVATEQGEFYVDHRDGGKLRFRNRYARFTGTRSTTAQATFSDDPSNALAVRVERSGLDVAPNGIDGIVNQAQVSWRDGEEAVEDTASVQLYGPRQRSIETAATTAVAARSAGEWLVARYAHPRSRVRGFTINVAASANALTAARNLRVGDRVTYRSHPQQVGSAIVIDLFVEGIEQSVSDGMHRSASYRLAPVNTFAPWIWGTSAWDTATHWG